MTAPRSILEQARVEAYREGWSQASMVAYDDAFEAGRDRAELERPSRARWFVLGCLACILVWWIIA